MKMARRTRVSAGCCERVNRVAAGLDRCRVRWSQPTNNRVAEDLEGLIRLLGLTDVDANVIAREGITLHGKAVRSDWRDDRPSGRVADPSGIARDDLRACSPHAGERAAAEQTTCQHGRAAHAEQ